MGGMHSATEARAVNILTRCPSANQVRTRCSMAGTGSPIPLAQIDAVARATFAILESLETGRAVVLEPRS